MRGKNVRIAMDEPSVRRVTIAQTRQQKQLQDPEGGVGPLRNKHCGRRGHFVRLVSVHSARFWDPRYHPLTSPDTVGAVGKIGVLRTEMEGRRGWRERGREQNERGKARKGVDGLFTTIISESPDMKCVRSPTLIRLH
ncbi:unnamed protein product [Prorocentrum cordatum]|uniref:Uncharacterized protein n=1 Tax=Prorocentrum cordatum TaxID=2364126 RepID=A0ABN9RNK1_9DINO|nr:unnamed protein product [Polarella glacialis]